jgi:hypothetical protein
MPFTVDSQPGEEIHLLKEFRGSHGQLFAVAVSNQAIYLPAQKLTLKKDSWYFRRVPLEAVKEVCLVKQKPLLTMLLSAMMIIVGGVTASLMMWYALRGETIRVSGWPFAVFVGGIVVPLLSRGRRILIVKMSDGKYKWKPQLAVDKKTREICSSLQDEIVQACSRVGIRTPACP